MTTKTKTRTKTKAKARRKAFDCVEMKDRIQAEVVAEYERRKAEFPSFYDFIRAENDKSDWVRRMRAKFGWS